MRGLLAEAMFKQEGFEQELIKMKDTWKNIWKHIKPNLKNLTREDSTHLI